MPTAPRSRSSKNSATFGSFAIAAADFSTASAYLDSVSLPLLACRTIGLGPAAEV
jgi:hypothetical protein